MMVFVVLVNDFLSTPSNTLTVFSSLSTLESDWNRIDEVDETDNTAYKIKVVVYSPSILYYKLKMMNKSEYTMHL